MPTVSIVIPTFNEEGNLPLLYQRLHASTAQIERVTMEFLFVDDASRDRTPDILRAFTLADPRVRGVRFARNFGSHTACLAGLAHACGDAMIIMSADLQDPPELIPSLIERWQEGYEIVWGVRESRQDPLRNKLQAKLFYWLFRKIAIRDFPASDVVLISKRVAQLLVDAQEKNTSLFGLIGWIGLPYATIPYARAQRHSGRSKWTVSKTIKHAIDAFVSFSFFPIRLMAYAGGIFLASAVVLLTTLFFLAVTGRLVVEGWWWVLSGLFVMGGFLSLMMGILGEYVWRALEQTRQRPMFILDEGTLSNAPADFPPVVE